MSLCHLKSASELIDVNCKSVSIEGVMVGMSGFSAENAAYAVLPCAGVGTVIKASGGNTAISGVSGCENFQTITFMCCVQGSTLTLNQGTNTRTPSGTPIVLSGVGEVAIGVFSSDLDYMTIVKV